MGGLSKLTPLLLTALLTSCVTQVTVTDSVEIIPLSGQMQFYKDGKQFVSSSSNVEIVLSVPTDFTDTAPTLILDLEATNKSGVPQDLLLTNFSISSSRSPAASILESSEFDALLQDLIRPNLLQAAAEGFAAGVAASRCSSSSSTSGTVDGSGNVRLETTSYQPISDCGPSEPEARTERLRSEAAVLTSSYLNRETIFPNQTYTGIIAIDRRDVIENFDNIPYVLKFNVGEEKFEFHLRGNRRQ